MLGIYVAMAYARGREVRFNGWVKARIPYLRGSDFKVPLAAAQYRVIKRDQPRRLGNNKATPAASFRGISVVRDHAREK